MFTHLFWSSSLPALILWWMELGKRVSVCVYITVQMREIVHALYGFLLSIWTLFGNGAFCWQWMRTNSEKTLSSKQRPATESPGLLLSLLSSSNWKSTMQIVFLEIRNRWRLLEQFNVASKGHNAEIDAWDLLIELPQYIQYIKSIWSGAGLCEIAQHIFFFPPLPVSVLFLLKENNDHIIWLKCTLVFSSPACRDLDL